MPKKAVIKLINAIEPLKPNGVATLTCDDSTDIPDLEGFSKSNNLKQGSQCMVIDTGEIYMMKSDYTWKIPGE